jgi:hypothetical protein
LFAVEGAGYTVFPSLLREDDVKWKAAHPTVKSRSGWVGSSRSAVLCGARPAHTGVCPVIFLACQRGC